MVRRPDRIAGGQTILSTATRAGNSWPLENAPPVRCAGRGLSAWINADRGDEHDLYGSSNSAGFDARDDARVRGRCSTRGFASFAWCDPSRTWPRRPTAWCRLPIALWPIVDSFRRAVFARPRQFERARRRTWARPRACAREDAGAFVQPRVRLAMHRTSCLFGLRRNWRAAS